ncbi:hypothetical protein R80B4_02102 [Fibrobacteres bacterium R8-0-B4]
MEFRYGSTPRFLHLTGQLSRGEITQSDFDSQIKKLLVPKGSPAPKEFSPPVAKPDPDVPRDLSAEEQAARDAAEESGKEPVLKESAQPHYKTDKEAAAAALKVNNTTHERAGDVDHYLIENRHFGFLKADSDGERGKVFVFQDDGRARLLSKAVVTRSEAEALITKHLEETVDMTKPVADPVRGSGGGEFEARNIPASRWHGDGEYSMDRFAEDGGGDYIRGVGEGSQTKGRGEVESKLETDNEKRIRFDALTPVEVSSDEVRGIERGDNFALRVIEWLKSKGILGKKYTNDDTGWNDVEINNMSVRNVIQHHAKDGKVALLEAAPELIQDGIFLETNRKNDRGLLSHIFAAKARVDGTLYAVGIVVHEDRNGRRYYDHSLTTIEALDRIDDQTPTKPDGKGQGLPRTTGSESYPTGKEPIINILKRHLKSKKKNKNLSGASGEANLDSFAQADDFVDLNAPPAASDLHPIEMPELVAIVKAILGKVPRVSTRMKNGAYGFARRTKNKDTGEYEWTGIELAASLPEDPGQAEKTLAHEIGHVMTKFGGNGKYKAVAQKIKNAIDTLKQFIGDDPKAVNLTEADRRRIRKDAERLLKDGAEEWIDEVITQETAYTPQEILDVWNSVDAGNATPELTDYIKGLNTAEKKAVVLAALKGSVLSGVPTQKTQVKTGNKVVVKRTGTATPAEVAAKYKEMILEEAEKRRLTEIRTIYDEINRVSKIWRPYAEGDKAHDAYRQKGEEVFADAISVYLNEPAFLEEEAPNFWRVFHGWEGARNPFTEVYKGIQKLIKQGEEAVNQSRQDRVMTGVKKAKDQDQKQAEKNVADKEKRAKRTGGNRWTKAVTAIKNSAARLGAIESALRKKGINIRHEDKATVSASDRNYAQSTIKEYTATVMDNVGKAIGGWSSKGWGTTTVDGVTRDLTAAEMLHLFMVHRRIATERAKIASTQGIDEPAANQWLAWQKEQLGDKYANLETAAAELNRIRQELVIPQLEDCGAFGDELITHLKENDAYAKFKVVFEGEDEQAGNGSYSVTPIHKQTGWFGDIGDVFVNTIRGDINLLFFARQNKHKINCINIMKLDEVKDMGYTVEEADKVNSVYLNLPANHKTLQTVHFSENGEHKAYNVDKDIAAIMETPSADYGALMKTLRVFGQFQRDVFINYAPTFHVKNPIRDVAGTIWKNPGIVIKGGLLGKLRKARRQAALLEKGKLTDTTRKMLRYGAINDGITRNQNTGEYDFESDLSPMGVDIPTAKKIGKLAKAWGMLSAPVRKVTSPIAKRWMSATGTLEHMTKIAGYEALRQAHPEWSEAELAWRVRKFVGTPDALEKGTWTPVLNELVLFSNANLQGTAATFEALREQFTEQGWQGKVRASGVIALGLLLKSARILAKAGVLAAVIGWIYKMVGKDDDDGKKAGKAITIIYDKSLDYYNKKWLYSKISGKVLIFSGWMY